MLSRNHSTEYGKSKGDFKVDGVYTFEVGGPDKGFSQIAGVDRLYVFADGIEMPSGRKQLFYALRYYDSDDTIHTGDLFEV